MQLDLDDHAKSAAGSTKPLTRAKPTLRPPWPAEPQRLNVPILRHIPAAPSFLGAVRDLGGQFRRLCVAMFRQEPGDLVDIRFVNHVALVAVADENGKHPIVGAGRYVVVQPGQAEVAFGVVDQFQGQGLGGAILRELAGVARRAGINELIAEVLGRVLSRER